MDKADINVSNEDTETVPNDQILIDGLKLVQDFRRKHYMRCRFSLKYPKRTRGRKVEELAVDGHVPTRE